MLLFCSDNWKITVDPADPRDNLSHRLDKEVGIDKDDDVVVIGRTGVNSPHSRCDCTTCPFESDGSTVYNIKVRQIFIIRSSYD